MKLEHFVLGVVIIAFLMTGVYIFGFSKPDSDSVRAVVDDKIVEDQVVEGGVVEGEVEDGGVVEDQVEDGEVVEGDVVEEEVVEVSGNLEVGEVVNIDVSKSSFEFEGFGPGRSHVGVFENWEGSLIIDNGEIVGFEGVIDAGSAKTGIDLLDSNLVTSMFFDVAKYPEIVFENGVVDGDTGEGSGDLTLLGVTKEISFPVEVDSESLSADFILDTSLFGEMSSLANDEVRIAFEFVI